MTVEEAARGLTVGDCNTRREAVRIAKEVLKRNEWIPTNKKLPKFGVKVLVTRRDGEIEIGSYFGHGTRERFTELGEKEMVTFPEWVYLDERISMMHPLAWMPLPEPYETLPEPHKESEDTE